eukprot:12905520-Prorocentrum_lima.AAC.1
MMCCLPLSDQLRTRRNMSTLCVDGMTLAAMAAKAVQSASGFLLRRCLPSFQNTHETPGRTHNTKRTPQPPPP